MFPGTYSPMMMRDYCQTFERLPGQSVQVTRVSDGHSGIVKDFRGDQPLFFDNCNYRDRCKLASPETSFFVYSNQLDLEQLLPLVTLLQQRNILVVQETEHNTSSIINNLRDSFYREDGSLIHNSFANKLFSPDAMAEAGFIFCGDELTDSVRCYFQDSVEIRNWDSYFRQDLSPENVHRLNCSCPGIQILKSFLPRVLSTSGADLSGKVYRLMGSYDCLFDCREIVVLSYKDCALRQIGEDEFMLNVDRVRLLDIKQINDYKATVRLKDREYYAQQQQYLLITHFAQPLRRLEYGSQEYIALLDGAKPTLPSDCYCQAKAAATSLLPSAKTEVVKVLEKLVNVEKSELDSVTLDYLGDAFLALGREAMAKCAKEDLAELASKYVKRFFLDDFLNDLLSTDPLSANLLARGCNTRKKKRETVQLTEKGSELNQSLRDVSREIKRLLEPYLDDTDRAGPGASNKLMSESGLLTPPHHAHPAEPEYRPSGLLAGHPQHAP